MQRMQRLAGREGISSADYFGAGDSQGVRQGGDSGGSNNSGSGGGATSNFSNLEDGAKDIARKVVSQAVADFNTIKNLAAVTAARIQNSISEMQRNSGSGGGYSSDGYGGTGGNGGGNRYSGY